MAGTTYLYSEFSHRNSYEFTIIQFSGKVCYSHKLPRSFAVIRDKRRMRFFDELNRHGVKFGIRFW